MEKTFWIAILLYYNSLLTAIMFEPAMIFVTAALFITIPSLTKTDFIPGMRESFEAQLEILETQMWLNREGFYYDN